jgi:hypothetical protein
MGGVCVWGGVWGKGMSGQVWGWGCV